MNIRSIASVKLVPLARQRLTAQEAVQHAAAMVPRLAERAAEAERDQLRVPPDGRAGGGWIQALYHADELRSGQARSRQRAH